MSGLKTIIGKELSRVFKDKKMVFSMFILPIFLVAGIFMLIFVLINNMQDDIEKHVSVVYVEEAPEGFKTLMADCEDADIKYVTDSDSIETIKQDIKDGKADLLIEFPDNFTDSVSKWDKSEIPQVKTYYNPSEDYSSEARDRFVTGYLEGYRQMLIADRFGSTESVMIFTVDSDNADSVIQDDDKAAGKMLGMFVPYFITMMIFAGAMGLGIDSIAGEKERGTLASLLLTPVKRVNIVLGKIIALGILSVLSSLVYLIGMALMFTVGLKAVGMEEMTSGLSISFTGTQIIELLVLVIGVVLLYVSLIGFVSVLAKNNKEAQTYIMPVYIIVIIAGMITMYTSDTNSIVSYMIPVFNSSAAFKGIFTREITAPEFLSTIVITYGCAAALVVLTARAFKSEKIMFNA